jgi:YegS/Rv2252/BmrU family lipid kinase
MPRSPYAVQVILLIVVLLICAAVLVVVRIARSPGAGPAAGRPAAPARPVRPQPLPAVVANPTKIADIDGELAWLSRRATELGWRRPMWFETQPDEPGTAAAREAISRGADVVLAYGGDGTVRAVAAGLRESEAALAILPAGTGNLLARNLQIPVTDLERAVEVAFAGKERAIDLGLVEIDVSGEDEIPTRTVFTVMAGLGFDAEVMAAVEPALKERVGWWAYVMAGARRLRGRTTAVVMHMDGGEPVRRRVRSVVVGNCGELTGGVRLLPDAEVDDGWLDVVVVAPRRVVEWGAVVVSVLSRARSRSRGHAVIQHFRCRSVEISAEKPLAVQLDGDPAGTARVLRASLDRLGLLVKVPLNHSK